MPAPPLWRVVEREALVFRRLWRGSVGFAFVNPLLFLGAMGFGLGGLVDEGSARLAMPYREFLAPGLMAASALQATAGDSLWRVLAGLKWVGSYKAMVLTPVEAGDVFGGVVLFAAARAGLAASAFLAVATLLGTVPSPAGVLAVPAAMLTSAAVAAPVTAFVGTQETDFQFSLVMRLGVLPLFLFSGTFFPVASLPAWLRPAAALSPLWHGVELCRAATTGAFRPAASAAHVAVLLAVVAAGWAWGRRTFTRRLTP